MQNSWFEISWQITVKIPARVLGFLLLRITLRPLEQALLAALLNLPPRFSSSLRATALSAPVTHNCFSFAPACSMTLFDAVMKRPIGSVQTRYSSGAQKTRAPLPVRAAANSPRETKLVRAATLL